MDLAILHGIQDVLGNPVFDAIFPLLTQLGQVGIFWILVGVVLLFTRKYRFWGMVVLVSLLAVGLLNEVILKAIVARPRPFLADTSIKLLVSPPSGYSFPSGHTGTSFAAATVIAFSPLARGWKVGAWLLAFALAFSRLYLCVHYPTDVLVGAILGMLYAFIIVKVALRLRKRNETAVRGAHAKTAE